MKSPGTVVLAVALASACCLGTGWISLARAGYIENVSWGFDVYLQQGAIEGNSNVNGAGIDGPYGEFVRSIAPGSPLAHVTQYPDHIRFEADDCAVGVMGDADICADIYFKEGLPSKVKVLRGPAAGDQSTTWRYIYDFSVDGKLIVPRWQAHYGEIIGMRLGQPLIALAAAERPSTLPQSQAWRVNTGTPHGSTANIDLNISADSYLDSVTLDLGEGGSANLAQPFPATITHSYTLSPGENARSFRLTASAQNSALKAYAVECFSVLRQPDVALLINGSSVFGGDTVQVEPGRLLQLSLADSLGYIEQASFSIGGKLDQAGAGLSYSGILFGDSDLGQTYPLTVGVSNTGAGTNSDSMTVNLSVVPEPGTLGLLGLAACCLVRKLRPAG